MSNNYDDDSGDVRAKRLIQDRLERLEATLDQFSYQAATVQLTPDMKREIAVHIVNLHRVLSNYEGETVLDDGDIPDISPIRERLGRETQIPSQSARRGGGTSYETRPAVDELGFEYLERVANQLERVAKKLEFWAPAPDKTEHDQFDHGDLAHLLDQRGQDEALEKVPGGDA